ncbi:RNA polymerase sigma factor [Pseudobacter ginsenosidimutans]|uniref:RNA polymerase sigma factor (Sigma-70 family) n=1 Tax=Pseudobacter ginsenosidimutans TaxID=661488 RepID=A0A4Q7N4K2_9BACT|nr:sigma-70 family RNA polymerase sigma factor [Pseudobacter ginsenosidimutans]QEC44456.1 sigma-70 family RNA polymerase sigma factor [Pseudobacter ginsenosidimutans]RZS75928.1 RNA polymerase sigma factor (sigma-70 family) [Pseudobacter ginsenosidimutans]
MNSTTCYPSVPFPAADHPQNDLPLQIFHAQFTKIVQDWTPHLQYRAWQITQNQHAAEDIVQEAFLALWQQTAKSIPDKPVGWLIRVVTNLSARYIRNMNIQVRIHESLSDEKNTSFTETEDYLIVKEKYALLKNIFNRLPEQQKIVLHLSKEKGWRRAEIAACLQLSPNTVKLHLHRAMRFMKDNLVCISIFVLLFICNNIFFSNSSTKQCFMEPYIKKVLSSENVEGTPKNPLLKNIAQVAVNSMKQ